ncbi:MAG: fumarylacetoacetate hydrolase family protein [Proteobacteria bacterium]|nr:fumarylacetoacetate hydrolase family protein [Pseudomonadota bacterium]
MKLLRFGPAGQEKPGILDGEGGIRDLSAIVDDIAGAQLTRQGLARLAEVRPEELPKVGADVRIGPCVGRVGKFICIGLNYRDHARESNLELPSEPVVFAKWTSAICGPNDTVIKPRGSTKLDWEVELGVVIGDGGGYIDERDAGKHIAGYCVINDVSERNFQLERGGQWDKGKGSDHFGPIGPWLVTHDEIGDDPSLPLWLEVNGRRFQSSNTNNMEFQPNFIVHYLSQFMSLQPGDVISTGTPAGVGLGQDPPIYLNPGDTMRLGIEGLGMQEQTVSSAD